MPSRTDDSNGTETTFATDDPVITQLNNNHFDAVNFLNELLPSLSLPSQTGPSKLNRGGHVQNASTDVQTLLSKLNSHNIRSSSSLTSLTDEILRSGNRLAYEVEILRGDANNLHELLTEALKSEILSFTDNQEAEVRQIAEDEPLKSESAAIDISQKTDPDFITQLRTLGQVKGRLEAVINIFGEALKWPIAPSEISMAPSLITPELGIQTTDEDDKAQEIARTIRHDITELLESEGGGYAGLEAAANRVEDFRKLAILWKGTVEEKARNRFVEGLARLVEERKKMLDARASSQKNRAENAQRPGSTSSRLNKVGTESSGGAAGLFRNLQRLKDDLYLE